MLELVDNFLPSLIMTDFEKALFKASDEVFINCIHKGCFFHFKQAIFRKIQKLELTRIYNKKNNKDSIKLRTLTSLALIPKNLMKKFYYKLKEKNYYNKSFYQTFIEYFESN